MVDIYDNQWQKQKKYFNLPAMILTCPACNAQFNVPDTAIPPAGRTVKCSSCKHQWHATLPVAAPKAQPKPQPKPEPVPVIQPEADTIVPVDHSFLEELARATDAPNESITHITPEPEPMPEIFASLDEPAKPQPAPKAIKTGFQLPFPLWPFKLVAPSLALIWFVVAFFAYSPSWIYGPLGGLYGAFGAIPTDGIVLADVAMQQEKEGQRTRYLISGNIVNQQASERQVPVVRVQMLGKNNEVLWAREYDVNKTLKPGEVYPFRITNAETSFAHNVGQLVVDVGHPLQMMFR